MNWHHDVWSVVTSFLDERDLLRMTSTEKICRCELSKALHWQRVVPRIMLSVENGRTVFRDEFVRCEICNIITDKTAWYVQAYCFDCYIKAFICTMS